MNSLISHGTLATMVKQYLREETNHRICSSCEHNYINDAVGKFCENCEIQRENLKKKIMETMNHCEKLLANEKRISLEKIHEEVNQLYVTIDQRTSNFIDTIDKYQDELDNLLTIQQKSNEINA